MELTMEHYKTLSKPEFVAILLLILNGSDFPSQIAKDLGKKQPTITAQLNSMEKLGIVEVQSREKVKKYKVNPEVLVEYAYSMVEDGRDYWIQNDSLGMYSEEDLRKINRKTIEKAIPADLIMEFLDTYAMSLIDLIQGRVRGLEEIFETFFTGLYTLDGEEKKRLFKVYKVNKSKFEFIVDFMGFELVNRGHGGIITAIYMRENYPEDYPKY